MKSLGLLRQHQTSRTTRTTHTTCTTHATPCQIGIGVDANPTDAPGKWETHCGLGGAPGMPHASSRATKKTGMTGFEREMAIWKMKCDHC